MITALSKAALDPYRASLWHSGWACADCIEWCCKTSKGKMPVTVCCCRHFAFIYIEIRFLHLELQF
jgi:hypothetical protein